MGEESNSNASYSRTNSGYEIVLPWPREVPESVVKPSAPVKRVQVKNNPRKSNAQLQSFLQNIRPCSPAEGPPIPFFLLQGLRQQNPKRNPNSQNRASAEEIRRAIVKPPPTDRVTTHVPSVGQEKYDPLARTSPTETRASMTREERLQKWAEEADVPVQSFMVRTGLMGRPLKS